MPVDVAILRTGRVRLATAAEVLTGHVTLLPIIYGSSETRAFIYFLPLFMGTRLPLACLIPYVAFACWVAADLGQASSAVVNDWIVIVAAAGTTALFRIREQAALRGRRQPWRRRRGRSRRG